MTLSRLIHFLSIAFIGALITGCGNSSMPKATIREKQQSLDDAIARYANRDYNGAKEAATKAVEGGGLNVDQIGEANLILIESCIRTNELDRAATLIAAAETNALELSQVFVLKSMLLRAKGDEAGAQAAFEKAQEYDRNATIPE